MEAKDLIKTNVNWFGLFPWSNEVSQRASQHTEERFCYPANLATRRKRFKLLKEVCF